MPRSDRAAGRGSAVARGVREIRVDDGGVAGAVMEDGNRIEARRMRRRGSAGRFAGIAAGGDVRAGGSLAELRRFKTSPITGVHLWFDRTVMTEPFLTLLDTRRNGFSTRRALVRFEAAATGPARRDEAEPGNICNW